MTTNRTGGVIQVLDNSTASINQALAQTLNRLDTALGLRGRAEVHDRLGAQDPTVVSDVLTRGAFDPAFDARLAASLVARETLFQVALLALGTNGVAVIAPGTTYVEFSTLLRNRVNFSTPTALFARLIVHGIGTQSGSGHGVALFTTAGVQIVEVTWDGTAETLAIGTDTAITLDTDQTVVVRVKGSSATDSLILRYISLECRSSGGSSLI
jgi:hypothetical protein